MARPGRVERELRRKIESGEKLFLLLSDPEKPLSLEIVARFEEAGADALLVGGSLNITPYDIDEYIGKLRSGGVRLPTILFPGGVNNVARSADAILFMSLLNSLDPYWLIGAQVSAALLVKRLGLEAIPTAYIIVGHGGAAGHVGRAQPIPLDNIYVVSSYAAAAELLGFHAIYVEAGSGSPRPVPPEAVRYARTAAEEPILIAGGGVREPEHARRLVEAGADAIVVGTLAEKQPEKALKLLSYVKRR
ncbi:geranylgeranylglyceryl/heptaprenylglyceryl phosphate synthase [Pyrodictium occultum]|uniref:Geranylgeranylglyceryl phosphate synthase n=1 Tax=Pyrodictium occultum TaxID=2309 RepID=A0A0V8RUK1_PYROC|nr:geranylgeranylglyceryl/heptaprenylglyceryl phosphate synthase [Pyrodictium occultum]KSW11748.1 geranylgeranylglyceryl/heptaprenylglyceryl phosphate synthase [Pyrodictium occultum]